MASMTTKKTISKRYIHICYRIYSECSLPKEVTSPSGGGKTNLLYRMLMAPMLFHDTLYLYAKNIEQSKHKHMIDNLTDVSKQVRCLSSQ